jgi:multidrug efflux system outer membrane protein
MGQNPHVRAVVCLIAACCSVAHADDRVPVTLEMALAASGKAPAAQIGTHDIAAAEANIEAATAWPNPAVSVATNRLTAKLVVGATLPLPIFGTVGAAKRVAAAEAAVVRAEADLALRDLRHRIVVAWIELLRAGGDVVASQVAAKQARDLEDIAKGRLDAGTGADVDVTVATAARARADVAVASAIRAEDAASAELSGLLGWDPSRPLRADGAPVIGPPPASLQGRVAAHPERQAAERRVAAAEANVEEVLVLRRPGFALEGELDYDDRSMTEGATPWDRTDARVGVALELPIFARIGARADAARATAAAQRTRLAAVEAELGGRAVAAFARWQAATERLAAMERDVIPAQEKAATLSMQAYREGARDLSSAVLAERDLATARAELNDARADAALAYAELAVSVGEDVHAK